MDSIDYVHTGPGTLAGKFLRMFWQPVGCSYELAQKQARPIRIMGEDFTLYRGETGTVHLVAHRCPHRGTQLSAGWIEGDCVRCFYHGWKFDSEGQCVEQPAEEASYAQKVRIASYPVKEYLGLIFAYFGAGEPPALPRYPKFEAENISLDVAALLRICNYFNNIENSLDNVHVRWVHSRHRDAADDKIVKGDPIIVVEESEWGVRRLTKYPDGKELTFYFGMPNINYINGQVVDPAIKRADLMVFKVPIDDESHIHFEVRAIPLTGDSGRSWIAERRAERAQAAKDRVEIVRAILAGKTTLDDLDPNRIDFILIEDEVAQTGQGVIADRGNEHLGRSDRGVFLLRKLWERELKNLAEGRPLKQWSYQPEMVPTYPK